MSSRHLLRGAVAAGLAVSAALGGGTRLATADAAAPQATVLVLQPGLTSAATRADARRLLAARTARGPVTVLLAGRPATVLVPPTRSGAAVRDGLATAPAAATADAAPVNDAADAILALAARVSSTPPSVVLAGAASRKVRSLGDAVERRSRAAGAPLRIQPLDVALERERVMGARAAAAGAPASLPRQLPAAPTTSAVESPNFAPGLLGLAVALAAVATALALRARPATASALSERVSAWTAPAAVTAPAGVARATDLPIEGLPSA